MLLAEAEVEVVVVNAKVKVKAEAAAEIIFAFISANLNPRVHANLIPNLAKYHSHKPVINQNMIMMITYGLLLKHGNQSVN